MLGITYKKGKGDWTFNYNSVSILFNRGFGYPLLYSNLPSSPSFMGVLILDSLSALGFLILTTDNKKLSFTGGRKVGLSEKKYKKHV